MRHLRGFATGYGRMGLALRLVLAVVFAVVVAVYAHTQAQAQQSPASGKRIALVVGIQEYEYLGDLNNPEKDARDIAALFKAHGIETTVIINPTHAKLTAGLSNFRKSAKTASLAIFYYAGHGMNLAGADVILPQDMPQRCDVANPEEALEGTVALEEVMESVSAADKSIVILDACRSGTFPSCRSRGEASVSRFSFRGLERVVTDGKGTLIATSTARGGLASDGPPGGNSPFASLFKSRLESRPRAYFHETLSDVAEEMRQVPGGQLPDWYPLGGLLPKACLSIEGCGRSEDAEKLKVLESKIAAYEEKTRKSEEERKAEEVKSEEERKREKTAALPPPPNPTATPVPTVSTVPTTPPTPPAAKPETPSPTPPIATPEVALPPVEAPSAPVALLTTPVPTPTPPETPLQKDARLDEPPLATPSPLPDVKLPAPSAEVPARCLGLVSRSASGKDICHAPGDGRFFRECWAEKGQQVCAPEMVIVPAGRFLIGSPPQEEGRMENEGPQQLVEIARPFAVGRFEVTREAFAAFVKSTGHATPGGCFAWDGKGWKEQADKSWLSPGYQQEDTHPVTCVNWEDATAYVQWLSRKTGKIYRLLTETEWEYVARGVTDARPQPMYHFGNAAKDLCLYGNGGDLTAKDTSPGWVVAECRDGHVTTAPVGSFKANTWGLFDMYGNVWEWVEDCYVDSYKGAPRDGTARTLAGCESRGLRGGAWDVKPQFLRTAFRSRFLSKGRYGAVGFRVARGL